MSVPSLELDAVTAAPTVSVGSVRRCVSETTSEGSLEGWMSTREPSRLPLIT